MRDEAARALRAYEQRLQPRRMRPGDAYEPPRRREAPPRAYGSRVRSDAAVARPPMSVRPAGGVPGRRTVEIRGQAPAPPRRRPSTVSTTFLGRPDRAAMWAFLLALFLVLMAVATAHAAVY